MTNAQSEFIPASLSVIVLALNVEDVLPRALESLVEGASAGLVREVVLADGGSTDRTLEIADAAGARIAAGSSGRGRQLATGARAARGRWLLFLHGDTYLAPGWSGQVDRFIAEAEGEGLARAGFFRLRFLGASRRARLVAAGANVRARVLAAPYGDQGLLISKALYEEIGGYRDLPLFEDVDLVDRIIRAKGRRALRMINARAVTDPVRYYRDGYLKRVMKNAACLSMYRLGRPPEQILKFYQSS